MASAELQTVLEVLKANPPVQGTDIASMRTAMNAMLDAAPLPEDMDFEPVDAGGVPAEWSTAEAAGSDRVVVYFHGGAYVMGSLATHRNLVAHISRRTGARVLSVDYRLAPEHPYPAAVGEEMIHVWHAFADLLPEGRDALDALAAFVDSNLD